MTTTNRTAAIVGLGVAARTIHLPALAKLTNIRVAGGCDPVAKSGDFHFPIFSTPSQMLEKVKPDILIIATPPAFHFELTCLGLRAGCHVLCEKPFTETLEEADALISLSHKMRRWIVVNNQYRFMNIHRKAKEFIGRPDFGKLLFLRAHQTFFTDPKTEAGWRGAQLQRTGKEFATHVLDLCRFFFDEEPVSILSRMPKPERPDGPDYLNLIQLEFPGDRVAHVILDRLSRGRHSYLDMQLDGTVGCVETHIGGGIELRAGVQGGTRKPFLKADISMGGWARLYHREAFQKIASDPLDIFASATSRLIKAFLEALDTPSVPPCNAEDNRRTLALMLSAYESNNRKLACAIE
jgi:predicted dehydrogenase